MKAGYRLIRDLFEDISGAAERFPVITTIGLLALVAIVVVAALN